MNRVLHGRSRQPALTSPSPDQPPLHKFWLHGLQHGLLHQPVPLTHLEEEDDKVSVWRSGNSSRPDCWCQFAWFAGVRARPDEPQSIGASGVVSAQVPAPPLDGKTAMIFRLPAKTLPSFSSSQLLSPLRVTVCKRNTSQCSAATAPGANQKCLVDWRHLS